MLFLLLILSIAFAGCVQPPAEDVNSDSGTDTPNGVDVLMDTVEAGDNIKVEYRGELENGEVFDASERRGQPLAFAAGAGQMIKGFDEAVIGMRLNQEKTVTIPAEKAYGLHDEKRVAELSKESFADFWDSLVVGMVVSSPEAGNGKVLELKENSAIIDFNHNLAGKTLVFWIKVVEISKS